jgi:hypothetical protein
MNAVITLTLAVVTGLSLGVGAAVVQEGGQGPLGVSGFDRAPQAAAALPQSGPSDMDIVHPQSPGVHTGVLTYGL